MMRKRIAMTKTEELDEIRENFIEFFEHGPEINEKFKDHYDSIYKDRIFFGEAGGLQRTRCRGFAVEHYRFTLVALSLKPSSFCNVRANSWPDT
jgi:hypothetical protein